jgi:hypothetical protein
MGRTVGPRWLLSSRRIDECKTDPFLAVQITHARPPAGRLHRSRYLFGGPSTDEGRLRITPLAHLPTPQWLDVRFSIGVSVCDGSTITLRPSAS